jgi:competence protein ComEA
VQKNDIQLEADMTAEKTHRFWLFATGLLILIIIAGSCFVWIRRDAGQPIVLETPPAPQVEGRVYISGAVANPGAYPLKGEDNIENLLQSSGGLETNADLSRIRVYVPQAGQNSQPQKIDINRAELWLLQALPNIGEVRAQAIIDYRQQNGPFQNIEEITKVPGISESTFGRIEALITVGE